MVLLLTMLVGTASASIYIKQDSAAWIPIAGDVLKITITTTPPNTVNGWLYVYNYKTNTLIKSVYVENGVGSFLIFGKSWPDKVTIKSVPPSVSPPISEFPSYSVPMVIMLVIFLILGRIKNN